MTDAKFSPDWIEDCESFWGRTLVGVEAHWCGDLDGLPIDETVQFYKFCTCTPDDYMPGETE